VTQNKKYILAAKRNEGDTIRNHCQNLIAEVREFCTRRLDVSIETVIEKSKIAAKDKVCASFSPFSALPSSAQTFKRAMFINGWLAQL